MAGSTGYPRLTAAGDSANDAFLDAITAAVDSFDAYVAKVNDAATILAGDNTTFKMQGVNGPAVSGATRTVKVLGRPDSEHQVFLTVLNAISDTFAAYRTKVNANAAITGGDTTCYKVQAINGPAVSGATVFYRSDSRFDTDLDDTETQINGLVDALSQFASAWNLKQGGTPTTLVVSTVRRLRPMQRSSTGGGGGGGGVSDPPTRDIAIDGGNSQSATVGTQPSTPLTVEVTDASDTVVEGESVTWTISGGGSITSTSLTDASGIASATPTLGTVVGDYTVTATTSTGASVSFTVTGTAAAAAILTAASSTSQSGTTSTVVADPPAVLVTDTYGNAVSGTTVTFAVTAGGGSRSPATVNSGADGVATLTSWTLGASAGTNTLTATVAGLSGSPVTFSASASASLPTQIAVQSGGSQTGVVAGQAGSAITFRVKDAGNTAVQGVTVSFSTTGTGSLSVPSAVTNASGDASVTPTTGTTVETATVTGTFLDAGGAPIAASTTIASTFGTKSKLAIQTQPSSSGSSGTALSQQPVVLIQDANSNTVTNATDTVTAAVQSGNAVITAGSTKAAVAGVATFSGLTLTDTDSGSNILRFSSGGLTVVDSSGTTLAPPVPVAVQFAGPITGGVEDIASLSASVYVVDSGNVAVPGATNAVTLALTTPGGATLSGTLTVNAVNGVASFSGIAVDTAGTYTFTATASGLTSATSGSFTITTASGNLTPNLPSGMTLHIDSDLTGVTLNTAISSLVSTGQAAGNMGITYDGTGGANMRVQLLSDQSWRNSYHTAFPVCPNGYDRVHVCQFGTATGIAYTINAGEKGRYLMNLPANTKSAYISAYHLISSNWYGQSGSGDWKKWYWRTQSEGPSILSFKGATTGTIRASAYVGAHMSNITGAPDTTITEAVDFNNMATLPRNQWQLHECLIVTESASNAGDGHLTYWVDGVKKFQITACQFTTGGGGNLTLIPSCEVLHYYGGGGTTSVPASVGPMAVLTGDHMQIHTSTSRIAVP